MYTQLKPFITSKGGTTPGWCLANVIKGYGIAPKYGSAWEAWQHTQQHGGNAPTGVDVPVFFSYSATIDGEYKNWGHIGVRLASGQFWSDGVVYPSISAYTANHSPRYVGWGESVNDVKVISEDNDMYMGKTAKYYHDKLVATQKELAKAQGERTTYRNRLVKVLAQITGLTKTRGK